MKRISTLSILVSLILCTSIKAGDYSDMPIKNRIQWSPYKHGLASGLVGYTPYSLEYDSTGLVSDYIEYSPYAFKYDGRGLVCDTLEYSPYAFTYGGSGLVESNSYYSPYAFGYKHSGLIYDTTPSRCYDTYNITFREGSGVYGISDRSCTGNYTCERDRKSVV